MTGIDIKPLGFDDHTNEYWKFPTSEDIYISTVDEPVYDDDWIAFHESIGKTLKIENGKKGRDGVRRKWKVLSSIDEIRQLIDLLGSSSNEQKLKQTIVTEIVLERSKLVKEAIPKPLLDSDVADVSLEDVVNSSINNKVTPTQSTAENAVATVPAPKQKPVVDNIPVALKLFINKGQPLEEKYVINQETVYEEDADYNDAEDETGEFVSKVNEFFNFTKGRK